MKDCYWSKLLLFGEYSMIFDSNALVIPLKRFSAAWEEGHNEELNNSRAELLKFNQFLSEDEILSELIDTSLFAAELESGIALSTNVPFSYGLGSSGTVVAAVYDRYAVDKIKDDLELKKIFSRMEGYFHGSSSGIDPLECYLGKPFRINSDGVQIIADDFLSPDIHVGLLDTKVKSDTKPFVEEFKKQRQDQQFKHEFEQSYLPHVTSCMDRLIDGNSEGFFESLQKLSQAQYRFFRKMIPENVLSLFEKKPDINLGIKILGSGGGGYMLLFTEDPVAASEYLREYDVVWL